VRAKNIVSHDCGVTFIQLKERTYGKKLNMTNTFFRHTTLIIVIILHIKEPLDSSIIVTIVNRRTMQFFLCYAPVKSGKLCRRFGEMYVNLDYTAWNIDCNTL
jgi:hypothetical protein